MFFPSIIWPCLFEAKLVGMSRHLGIRQEGVEPRICDLPSWDENIPNLHICQHSPHVPQVFPVNMSGSSYTLEDLDSSFQAILYCIGLSKSRKFRALVMFSLVRYKYSCYLFNSRDIIWFMRSELCCIRYLVPLSPAAAFLILSMTSNMVFVCF